MDSEQRAQLRDWARQVERQSEHAEARAAARAVLLMADRVDELERELEATRAPERPREPAPAANRRRRRGRDQEDGPARAATARPEPSAPSRRLRATTSASRTLWLRATKSRRLPGRRALVMIAAAVVLAGLVFAGYAIAARVAAPDLVAGGPPAELRIGAAGLERLVFWVEADTDQARDTAWRIDGRDVTDRATQRRGRLTLTAYDLPDGEHTVEVRRSGPFPGATARRTWKIALDTTAPTVRLASEPVTASRAVPFRVEGTVEPGATVTVGGKPVDVEDGRFTIARDEPPAGALALSARDAYGNTAGRRVRVLLVPRRPPAPLRSVHVTAHAWANPGLRRGILRLVDEGRVNSVELDLKDESGLVGFAADVPLGLRMGAVQEVYDLRAAVELLHARGVHVVGRLVCFRDPIHAAAAWEAGRHLEVVQTPEGTPYAGYGGFTNLANPAVRRYNIDVAVAAAKAGIDDILYDYVRRPDGPTAEMRFAGLRGTPEAAVVRFLRESRKALRPYGVFLGASVFGVAATRPLEVAQDIPKMARQLDYIAPMLYPSHWGPGEYDVANPNGEPYQIVLRSLRDFQRQTRNTGARVVPWLQDFSLGVDYGPAEVSAQIRAAKDVGIDEWLLWDPNVTYTSDALVRLPTGPARETRALVADGEDAA